MYIIIFLFLHRLHHVHHQNTNYNPSPHTYRIIPFTLLPSLFPSGNHQSNLCPYVFVYCCYYLLLNEGNHTGFDLLPLTYFTLHYTLNVHPWCHKWLDFIVSYGWVVFHCVYIPQLLYLFVPWWALRLLPSLGYCE